MIVDNLKNNNKMRLNEIVSNIRLRFATEITSCRAFKLDKLLDKLYKGTQVSNIVYYGHMKLS